MQFRIFDQSEETPMISRITFPKKSSKIKSRGKSGRKEFDYIAGVSAVNGKTFTFKPGLNIVIGQNGSGKSTILKACALSLAAYQGGFSTVTKNWCQDLFGFSDTIQFPWNIAHDGQPVFFVDPRVTVGLAHGGFDDDFFNQGIMNVMNRASTGENTAVRINKAIGVIVGKEEFPQ